MYYRIRAFCNPSHAPVIIYQYHPTESLKFLDTEFRPSYIDSGVYEFLIKDGAWNKERTIYFPDRIHENYRFITAYEFRQGNVQFPYSRIVDVHTGLGIPLFQANHHIMEKYIK